MALADFDNPNSFSSLSSKARRATEDAAATPYKSSGSAHAKAAEAHRAAERAAVPGQKMNYPYHNVDAAEFHRAQAETHEHHAQKLTPKTKKSEPRAAILARGILAAVELRKAVPPEMEASFAHIRAQQAGAKAIGVKKLYTGRHGTSQGMDPRKWDPAAHQEAADAYRHAADLSEKAGADPNHITHAKMRAAEHDIKAKIAGHLQSGDHAAARTAISELVALPHGNPDTKARLSALASKLR